MSGALETSPTSPHGPQRRRRGRRMGGGSSLAAQGEPMLWLTGGALAVSLAMIVGLLGLILYQGTATFWPGLVEQVTLADGRTLMGEVTRSESYDIDEAALADLLPRARAAAEKERADRGGPVVRHLIRTGNYELTGSHFHWVSEFEVVAAELPPWAMVVERVEQGRFYGTPRAIVIDGKAGVTTEGLEGAELEAAQADIWATFQRHHPEVAARRREIRRIQKEEQGSESYREDQARLAARKAELKFGPASAEAAAAQANYRRIQEEVQQAYARFRDEIAALQAENDRQQIVLATADRREQTLGLADVVRMFPANQLGPLQQAGVYLARWREFLLDDPREANQEGGVWPAIVGTVTMTLLMAIAVVPFGVVAALYLREYARAGPLISAVRIAINNLAGVPSIVFGVFGLGFFCYIVGSGIDGLFFPAQVADGNPVYGKGALIWASLTLALLTLPVVIVAAEEALSAVPNSVREGSYACGASRWQTIRRVVLPQAMPGIMTGTILAMARGAGEVAPLMLVGAVKLAPFLPVDGQAPFVHPERSFMHLGFHIYDVGFQSPNSEAAKPMVFTTTLLLLALIALLNVVAIWLRSRLMKRFVRSQF